MNQKIRTTSLAGILRSNTLSVLVMHIQQAPGLYGSETIMEEQVWCQDLNMHRKTESQAACLHQHLSQAASMNLVARMNSRIAPTTKTIQKT